MVQFNSLLRVQGRVSVPAVHGSLVFWWASGSCVRVPASFSSLSEVRRAVRDWAFAYDSVVSVSFWCGGVLVARCFGSFALSLGACSLSDCWVPRVFVA